MKFLGGLWKSTRTFASTSKQIMLHRRTHVFEKTLLIFIFPHVRGDRRPCICSGNCSWHERASSAGSRSLFCRSYMKTIQFHFFLPRVRHIVNEFAELTAVSSGVYMLLIIDVVPDSVYDLAPLLTLTRQLSLVWFTDTPLRLTKETCRWSQAQRQNM